MSNITRLCDDHCLDAPATAEHPCLVCRLKGHIARLERDLATANDLLNAYKNALRCDRFIRDNLRADLRVGQERIAALTEAVESEYLAGVEWSLRYMSGREDWPVSWDAGFPELKAQALLDRATHTAAKETA